MPGCINLPASGPRPGEPLNASEPKNTSVRPKAIFSSTEKEIESRRRYKFTRVELHGTTNGVAAGQTIVLDYFQPKKQPGPVILLLPVAGGDYEIEHHFARYFARHGLAVVLSRRTDVQPEDLPDLTVINAWLERTLEENRRILDWVETRPELDPARMGVFGISLGSLQAVLLTGADNRIRASVFGLTGGDIPYILSHSTEHSIVKRRRAYQLAHKMTKAEFEEALRQCIKCEPNTVAGSIDPEEVLLVLGAFDRVVPFKKGWELRQRLGRPETILLPTGHYSAVLFVPYLEHASSDFFRWQLPSSRHP